MCCYQIPNDYSILCDFFYCSFLICLIFSRLILIWSLSFIINWNEQTSPITIREPTDCSHFSFLLYERSNQCQLIAKKMHIAFIQSHLLQNLALWSTNGSHPLIYYEFSHISSLYKVRSEKWKRENLKSLRVQPIFPFCDSLFRDPNQPHNQQPTHTKPLTKIN